MEGDYCGDELVLPVALRKVDRGGHEDHRTVGVIELETIAIDEADGGMRTKWRNQEHFQEVTTDLKGRINLVSEFGFGRRAILVLFFSLNTRSLRASDVRWNSF